MKQKDLALIAVVVAVGLVLAIVVSKFIFVSPKNRQQTVEVVPSISSDFQSPDTNYFNGQSVDPTQLITIGNSNNNNPFNPGQ